MKMMKMMEIQGKVERKIQKYLDDEERRRLLLDYLRRVEGDRTIMGASAHLLAVSRK